MIPLTNVEMELTQKTCPMHDFVSSMPAETWSDFLNLLILSITSADFTDHLVLNPLTPGTFCQKCISWTFWRFSIWILVGY